MIERDDEIVFDVKTERRRLPLEKLVIIPNTEGGPQRQLIEGHARSIAEKFDEKLWEAPEVCPLGDDLFSVIKGQHRITAAKYVSERSGKRVWIDCEVRTDEMTLEEQSRRFLASFAGTKPLSSSDRHLTAVNALDRDALEYQRILDMYGLRIWTTNSDAPGTVSPKCYALARSRFGRKNAAAALHDLFKVAEQAWGPAPHIPYWTTETMLVCLREWANLPQFKRARFVETLKKVGSGSIGAEVRKKCHDEKYDRVSAMLLIVGREYNHGLRFDLRVPLNPTDIGRRGSYQRSKVAA